MNRCMSRIVYSLLLIACLQPVTTHAQVCVPQVAILTEPPAGDRGYFGQSVCLSASGNIAFIGAPRDANDTGTVFPYEREGNSWVRHGPKLIPSAGTGPKFFGTAVTLSADGQVAMVGSPQEGGGVGSVYVFVQQDTGWTQYGAKLKPPDGAGASGFGTAIALSADGHTAIIGAPSDSSTSGAAHVFILSNGNWVQAGPKLTVDASIGSQFGSAVAISGDGLTVLVGAPGTPFAGYPGSHGAFVFIRSGGSWLQQGERLYGHPDAGAFGCSVALSADGNIALIGAFTDDWTVNGITGSAYGFERNAGEWTQSGPKLTAHGLTPSGRFGRSVALSSDGRTALIGSYTDDGWQGAAYLFLRYDHLWVQPGPKLVGPPLQSGQFGYSVSLSGSGDVALAGNPFDGVSGSAVVFGVNSPVSINQQPRSATVPLGGSAVFSVIADSNVPLTYQWRRNGVALVDGPALMGSVVSGATSPTLKISNVRSGDTGGAFDCVVTNPCQSRTSIPASLTVPPACLADLNQDGFINTLDLVIFLGQFGRVCPQ